MIHPTILWDMACHLLISHDMNFEDRFRFILNLEIQRAVRHSAYFSIFIVKLEGLDEHAHLLSAIDSICDDIRETDERGLLTGKKAAAILRTADTDNLDNILKRIDPKIRNHPVCSQQAPCIYKLEIGGACFPNDGTTPDDLLTVAEGNCREL